MNYKFFTFFLISACGPLDTTPAPFPKPSRESAYNIPNNRVYKKTNYLNCKQGTFLTYDNFGEDFFLNYCTSCHSSSVPEAERHGAPLLINLDTPEDIQLNRAGILDVTRAYLQDIDEKDENDSDGDGIPNDEEDENNNGIPDVIEDENGNGIPDIIEGGLEESGEMPEDSVLMPPSGALPIPTLRLLKEYLECGAPAGTDKISN